jgi:hypothetical protein
MVNFFLCSGCYREYDPKTDSIIKPSNLQRQRLAKRNGKLVLPCDSVVEPVAKPIILKKGESVTLSNGYTIQRL